MCYASKRIPHGRLIRIQRTSGCYARYLGAPIYKGRCKCMYFDETVGKLAQKLEGWKSRFLSFGGKITLIRSVLASLPLHVFSCMVVPQQVQRRIEGLMRAFLWSQQGQGRMNWVSWKRICTPVEEGGLGIRSIHETVHGLHGKLAWKIISKETLWTRLLRQKYGVQSVFSPTALRTNSSNLWRTLFPHFQTLLQMSHWEVGKGDIQFWSTNWCGEILGPEHEEELSVKEVF